MKYVVSVFVALAAACSVLFGLDFAPAPMSPMPASKYDLRAAAPPPPPAPVAVTAETKTAPKTEAAASADAAKPITMPVATPVAPAPVAAVEPPPPPPIERQPTSIAADEPSPIAAAPPPAPRCDLDACAAAYRSFTAEDCTYQPFDGPRQLCTKGTPPAAVSPAAGPATPVPEARAQACNIAACSQSYPRSFNSTDCTFQPAEGPRRLCTK